MFKYWNSIHNLVWDVATICRSSSFECRSKVSFRKHALLLIGFAFLVLSSIPSFQTGTCAAPMFALTETVDLGKGAMAIGVLDADSDGDQDIVFPGTYTQEYFLLINNGSGQFKLNKYKIDAPGSESKGNQRPKGIGLHDFNNDGLMDLYLGNEGKGTLSRKPADDPNGRISSGGLNLSSDNSVWISNGDGTF